MKRRSWKVWVAGIALVQLLVIGVDVALLWPEMSEVDELATFVRPGMTEEQVYGLVGEHMPGRLVWVWGAVGRELWRPETGWAEVWTLRHRFAPTLPTDKTRKTLFFEDGSKLIVYFQGDNVISVDTTPPPPTHPLTRLRRTLAGVFPFLAE
jgi:hypothetical protein